MGILQLTGSVVENCRTHQQFRLPIFVTCNSLFRVHALSFFATSRLKLYLQECLNKRKMESMNLVLGLQKAKSLLYHYFHPRPAHPRHLSLSENNLPDP
jgi:hypothetical protein